MNTLDTQFSWKVSPNGYRWLKGETDWYLEFCRSRGETQVELEERRPLSDNPALFKEVASLTDRASMVSFANKYGLLTGDSTLYASPKRSGGIGVGESYSKWCAEIARLQWAVLVWEALIRQDQQELQKIVIWQQHKDEPAIWRCLGREPNYNDSRAKKGYRFSSKILLDSRRPSQAQEMRLWIPAGDVVSPAWILLHESVNAALRRFSETAIQWNNTRSAHIFTIQPRSLLGAVWQQFASTIVGGGALRNCNVCGVPLVVGAAAGGRRKHTRFCSDRCRMHASRKRKKEAVKDLSA